MQAVKFVSDVGIIKFSDIIPVPVGESSAVVLDVKPDNENVKYIQGNTQGHFRFKATLGSLTDIRFKIWFYSIPSINNTYPQTVSQFSGAEERISPVVRIIPSTDSYDYYFTVPACTGIKITVWGTGTNTGSKLEEVHLAFRTN
jgi:hypothetical protein